MVEYNPRESKLSFEDTTENELQRMRAILSHLLTMISRGNNISDIRRYANSIAGVIEWPPKPFVPLEMPTGDEEE